ncbi:hypothetical protein DMJ13_19640 [halophilic archaeon]|nr:hypothetical protein DMJ13_19640 [halophilic archaeon]
MMPISQSLGHHSRNPNRSKFTLFITILLLRENVSSSSSWAPTRSCDARRAVDTPCVVPDREGISTTSQYAKEHGFTLDVSRIYDVDRAQRVQYELTEDQRNALAMALEHGYYEVPREIDQSTLADNLGISHQAMSERLR